MRSYKFKKRN